MLGSSKGRDSAPRRPEPRPFSWAPARRTVCAVGRVVVLATSATLLAGCGRVAVDDPRPDEASVAVCAGVLADLPESVLDQGRRTVEPGRYSAAWGKPAIVLRCGVAAPAALTNESECLEVDGVGWLAEDADGGTIFTTIGRPTYVEVAVPTRYAPESGALVDVGDAVVAHDPATKPCG